MEVAINKKDLYCLLTKIRGPGPVKINFFLSTVSLQPLVKSIEDKSLKMHDRFIKFVETVSLKIPVGGCQPCRRKAG